MAEDTSSRVSRRRFLLGSGTATALALAGCTSQQAAQPDSTTAADLEVDDGTPTQAGATTAGTPTPTATPADSGPLTADGSSTVFPIANQGSRLWNGNPPATDEEYWGPSQFDIQTDEHLADYFASMYGFEPTGERSTPVFRVTVALSHSGTGVKSVSEGRTDIGNSSAPVADELPEASEETLQKFENHVVGVDGQPIVVSRDIYDAGVTQITKEQLKQIYTGEITSWAAVGGPDKTIRAIGRAEGSGTDTAFRANLYGDPDAQISPDVRKGKNQQVKSLVANSDNAIAYLALAFVDEAGAVPPIGLKVGETVYEYGKNLGSKEYPLSRDLHMYTWDGTSMQEAAFINMLLSEFGQERCVAANNYFTLPPERREAQREKLPDQV